MTCRDEILTVANKLAEQSDNGEFILEDVLAALKNLGSKYTESTIRTHVSSRLCSNAPDNHAVTYNDLIRINSSTYKLI